jgi:hypothetical protein
LHLKEFEINLKNYGQCFATYFQAIHPKFAMTSTIPFLRGKPKLSLQKKKEKKKEKEEAIEDHNFLFLFIKVNL